MDRRAAFPTYATTAELQDRFFLTELPSRTDGHYFYRERGLDALPGAIVLFQSDNQIIASAVFRGSELFARPDTNGYKGHLSFDVRSIRVFDPVGATAVKRAWPFFKGFSQVKQSLDVDGYSTFASGLNGIRYPIFWLHSNDAAKGDEGDGEVKLSVGIDRRSVVERQIRERRGQYKFRNALRKRYGDRCLVTGCKVVDVLEAAHINTSPGEDDNRPENGLLLRADIHTLFDLDLLGIEPQHLRVNVHPDINSEYADLDGKTLLCDDHCRPSQEALQLRHRRFSERLDGGEKGG
jgi:hypothetical protein